VHKSKESSGSNRHVTCNVEESSSNACEYDLLEGVYLHVDKLDSSSITRGDNMEHFHTPAVTIPRGAILEDLRDLWSNVLRHVC
jgi:hypothetical protein